MADQYTARGTGVQGGAGEGGHCGKATKNPMLYDRFSDKITLVEAARIVI
jgi:hypothetical protein